MVPLYLKVQIDGFMCFEDFDLSKLSHNRKERHLKAVFYLSKIKCDLELLQELFCKFWVKLQDLLQVGEFNFIDVTV